MSNWVLIDEAKFEGDTVKVYFDKDEEEFVVAAEDLKRLSLKEGRTWDCFADAMGDLELALRQHRLEGNVTWKPYVVVTRWRRNDQHGDTSLVLSLSLNRREVMVHEGQGFYRHTAMGTIGVLAASSLPLFLDPAPEGFVYGASLWIPDSGGVMERWEAKLKDIDRLYFAFLPEPFNQRL